MAHGLAGAYPVAGAHSGSAAGKNAFEALTQDSRSGIFDLACPDELGNPFIVARQLAHTPHFGQRMKFYALHKFGTVVERGRFDYANLPRIY